MKYVRKEKLGQGTYDNVFKGENAETHEPVLITHMKIDQKQHGIPSFCFKTISIIKKISHPNILRYDVEFWNQSIHLVNEVMAKDLNTYQCNHSFSPELLRSYSFQLLCGICYLHQQGIIHHHICPKRIFLAKDGLLKIGDFNYASTSFYECDNPFSSHNITLWYYPPEYFVNQDLDFPVDSYAFDVWSAGCVIGEMIKHKPLFPGDSHFDQKSRIFSCFGTPDFNKWQTNEDSIVTPGNGLASLFPQEIDEDLMDLLLKLLEVNPKKRISAKDALQHSYFATLLNNQQYQFFVPFSINDLQQ